MATRESDALKHLLKAGVAKAKRPGAVAAYTLLHSVTTDLIRAGLPALTGAQLSGSSAAMIGLVVDDFGPSVDEMVVLD